QLFTSTEPSTAPCCLSLRHQRHIYGLTSAACLSSWESYAPASAILICVTSEKIALSIVCQTVRTSRSSNFPMMDPRHGGVKNEKRAHLVYPLCARRRRFRYCIPVYKVRNNSRSDAKCHRP